MRLHLGEAVGHQVTDLRLEVVGEIIVDLSSHRVTGERIPEHLAEATGGHDSTPAATEDTARSIALT